MDVPNLEVGYTSATTRRGDHKVHDGNVLALENNNNILRDIACLLSNLLQIWCDDPEFCNDLQ
jgi:hypothetical protein